jgi:hypothetical protein
VLARVGKCHGRKIIHVALRVKLSCLNLHPIVAEHGSLSRSSLLIGNLGLHTVDTVDRVDKEDQDENKGDLPPLLAVEFS